MKQKKLLENLKLIKKEKIRVSKEDLEVIKAILGPQIEAMAFGSRVTGNSRPFSDLDICIVNQPPPTYDEISRIKEEFENSNLSFQVDVSVFEDLPEEFRMKVKETGVKI